MQKKKPSILRSLGLGMLVILIITVYAYGFKVTDVNFETTRSEDRLTQLKRVLRALVKPDILEYEYQETEIDIPFYLPCPEDQELDIPEPDKDGPYLEASRYCASPEETITVEGYNFSPSSRGPVHFVTASGVQKQLGNFQTNREGYFQLEVELPKRQPVAEAQHIRAIARVPVGNLKFTDTAKVTGEKIIETVFIALLATTIGTAVAIPISFLAARNLMSTSKSPLTSIALSIIGWPSGIFLGIQCTKWIQSLLTPILNHTHLTIGAAIVSPGIGFLLLSYSLSDRNQQQSKISIQILRAISFILVAALGISTLIYLEHLARIFGQQLIELLGAFGFLGNFLLQLGETASLLIPVLVALGAGAAIGGILGKVGQTISDKAAPGFVKVINLVTSSLAGAILFALVGAGIDWFYKINDLTKTLYWPAGIGAFLGLVLALVTSAKKALPSGLVVYFITRTILNGTRSVEPLVMAIVFVIWVGIGPFAGSLALALHTIAALAKLYSEQVESIMPGPLEAVQATGANRIQTIIYAVVPQIISPYISFTMYRWDINVRMSTIIGFVGGGGIGFLLQQNINLLDYRAASAQMLAIAVVVAIMDYVSSAVRERIV